MHYHLWKLSVATNEIIFIFEHDAVITGDLPNMAFDKVVNMGKPSYGNYNTPTIFIPKVLLQNFCLLFLFR